jgi:hypothetical protein
MELGFMATRIIVSILALAAAAILLLRIGAYQQAEREVPLIALMCLSGGDAADPIVKAMTEEGLRPNLDYRFQMYACNSPGSPRKAMTELVTGGAKAIILMEPAGRSEARRSGLPLLEFGARPSPAGLSRSQIQETATFIRSLMPKAATRK